MDTPLKRLYFVDKEGVHHFVQQGADIERLHKACWEDRQRRGFKESSYIRQWVDNGGLWIDFGSWSEFYFIDGVTLEDMCK